MAGIRYIDLVSDIESISNITSQRALVKRLVNQGVASIASEIELPFLWTEAVLTTTAEYTTGTVDVTNGSKTITGNATTFTSDMVGRKFRAGSEQAYYKIAAFVSTTELTLDSVYQGSTDTAITYSIFQDEYRLNADVEQYKLFRQMENGVALFSSNVDSFDMRVPTPTAMGDAEVEVFIGTEDDTYSTGTVAMTSSSRTITGTSTVWSGVQGLSRGNKIQIGTTVFTIKSVDSDTQLTVYEAATATISAGTAYVIQLDNMRVLLHDIPDSAENYRYRYQRIPAILDADEALPELPYSLQPLIKDFALITMWEYKGFPDRSTAALQRYIRGLASGQKAFGMPVQNRKYPRRSRDAIRTVPTLRLLKHGRPFSL